MIHIFSKAQEKAASSRGVCDKKTKTRARPDLSRVAFLKSTFSTKLKFNEKAISATERANDNDTMIQGSKSQPPEPEPDPAEVWRFTGSCLLSGILSRKVKVKLLLKVVSILLL